MNKKFNFSIILIFYIISLISCNVSNFEIKKRHNNVEIIKRKTTNTNTNYFIQHQKIELQILNNNKLNVGNIDKICYDKKESLIVVLDKRTNPGVYIYNSSGNYLNQIGALGRGPGEYIAPEDMILIKNMKQIIIVDREGMKIIIYSYNGKYLNQFSTKINNDIILFPDAIKYSNERFYIFHLFTTLNGELGVSEFDLNGKYIKSMYNLDARTSRGPVICQFHQLFNLKNNHLFIPSMYSLNIAMYNLENGKLSELCIDNQILDDTGKDDLKKMDYLISKEPPYNFSRIQISLFNNIEHFNIIKIASSYNFIKTNKSIFLYDKDWNLKFSKDKKEFKIGTKTYSYPRNSKYMHLFTKIVGSWDDGIICAGYPPSISGEFNNNNPIIRFYKFSKE